MYTVCSRGNIRFYWCAALVTVLLAEFAIAGSQWVQFVEQTSQRVVADAAVSTGDSREKDFTWGDVDKDGDIDLISVRKQPFSTAGRYRNVLFMNEAGLLVDRTVEYASAADDGGQGFLDETNDRDVQLADLNGDSWLDIITATTYGEGLAKTISHPRVYINLKNNALGAWQGFRYEEARFPQLPSTPTFCDVGVGDVDDDGDLDLYFADYGDLEDRLLINNGSGHFEDQTESRVTSWLTDASFSTTAEIADLNLDGYADIIKNASLSPYEVRISYNDPSNVGYFDVLNGGLGSGSTYFFSVGNLNNDEWPDMVVVADGSDFYHIGEGVDGSGRATFSQTPLPQSEGIGGSSLIADLDMDGWNDVLVSDVDVDFCCCGFETDTFRNSGGSSPVLTREFGVPWNNVSAYDFAVFDINGDSLNDVVLGGCDGLRVYINATVSVQFDVVGGAPNALAPETETEVLVNVSSEFGDVVPSTVRQHVSVDGGFFVESVLVSLGDGSYRATLPALNCPSAANYYFSAEATNGATYTNPFDAPNVTYSALVSLGADLTLDQRFEGETPGWTVQNIDLTAGAWERVDPVGTMFGGVPAQPENDAGPEGETMCFITQQHTGGSAFSSDVDGGPTILTSPPIDLAGTDAMIEYARWHFTQSGTPDSLKTQVSDNGVDWVDVSETFGTGVGWESHAFRVGALVEPTANVRVRFMVMDGDGSITESGIDNFTVTKLLCDNAAGPEIVHGQPGVSFRDHAFGGYIDPSIESGNGVDIENGINKVVIGFTEAVFAIDGGAVSPSSFEVTQTGIGPAPSVIAVNAIDESTFRLTLSKIIALQEWTTIIASVKNEDGVFIENRGNLGAGINEPNRLDIAYLPGDVNQSGSTSPFDLLRLRLLLHDNYVPQEGLAIDFVDVNRNLQVDAFDLLRFRQIVNGVFPATQVWGNTSMNNPRP